ncbi:MAG: acyl-ACP--UDP-N-acetylglucosamine O-acyltransferase [Burkholderiaceae bacterium]
MSAVQTPVIHPTALIDPRASIDSSVRIGPYAVIGPAVSIDAGCEIGSHCVVDGPVVIGRNNTFHPFSRIGGPPQDKKYSGEPTTLTIGHDNMFREYVTLNRGTVQDRAETSIGNHNWVMAYVHIAHDCIVGNHTILANTTNLAGHVQIGDWVILGGYTGVHQFCKIGAHAMTGVGSVVLHDVPPYVMASGDTANAHGINSEGLKRRGFEKDRIANLRQAYKTLYKNGLGLAEAKKQVLQMQTDCELSGQVEQAADLALLTEFLDQVTRGIVR